MAKLPEGVILLDEGGEMMTSVNFSKRFDEWMKDGNVMIRSDIKGRYYSTQDALYKNRIESKAELLDFFVTEFNS